MTDQDTEWAFVRILAVRGRVLSGQGMSAEDRRERIRCAILEDGMRSRRDDFGKGMETFEQAYVRCYTRPLDVRRFPRKDDGTPAFVPQEDDEVEDSHDDDDGMLA